MKSNGTRGLVEKPKTELYCFLIFSFETANPSMLMFVFFISEVEKLQRTEDPYQPLHITFLAFTYHTNHNMNCAG